MEIKVDFNGPHGTLEITSTLSEWATLKEQLGYGWPSSQLSSAIGHVVWKLETVLTEMQWTEDQDAAL